VMQLVVLAFASCFLTVTSIIIMLVREQVLQDPNMTANTSTTGGGASFAALRSCDYIKMNDI
jgi:hypothetical protein